MIGAGVVAFLDLGGNRIGLILGQFGCGAEQLIRSIGHGKQPALRCGIFAPILDGVNVAIDCIFQHHTGKLQKLLRIAAAGDDYIHACRRFAEAL